MRKIVGQSHAMAGATTKASLTTQIGLNTRIGIAHNYEAEKKKEELSVVEGMNVFDVHSTKFSKNQNIV